jgi:hypothetical protein
MISEKQLDANRANAQKSTGPKTEPGKQRSSLNATRHGLTGQVLVLPEPELAAYNKFMGENVATLQAEGKEELTLAGLYSTNLWKLQQAFAAEETLFTLGEVEGIADNLNLEHPEAHTALSRAKTFRTQSQLFARMSLYIQRLTSSAKSLRKQLSDVQAARRAREAKEEYDAIRAYKFKKMLGEDFDPAKNGFVSSLALVETRIHRDDLDKDSFAAEKCGYDRVRYMKNAA